MGNPRLPCYRFAELPFLYLKHLPSQMTRSFVYFYYHYYFYFFKKNKKGRHQSDTLTEDKHCTVPNFQSRWHPLNFHEFPSHSCCHFRFQIENLQSNIAQTILPLSCSKR